MCLNYLSLSTWYFWRCRIKNSLKIICFSQFLQSTHFRYGTTWCVCLSRTCQPICHHRSVIYNKSSLVSSLMPPQVALGRYCLKMIQLWNLVHTGEKTCSLASNPSHLGTFYRHLKIDFMFLFPNSKNTGFWRRWNSTDVLATRE